MASLSSWDRGAPMSSTAGLAQTWWWSPDLTLAAHHDGLPNVDFFGSRLDATLPRDFVAKNPLCI